MNPIDLERLEQRTAELIKLCIKLHSENDTLRQRAHKLQAEYQKLYTKHQTATKKINNVISRIKSLSTN